MHKLNSRVVAVIGVLAVALGSITCADSATGPKPPRARVGLTPVFSEKAANIYGSLASFELEVNNVRVRLLRENDEVAVDTVVIVEPGQDSIVLEINVPLTGGTQETFEAAIELRDGNQILFSGIQTVIARSGPGGSPRSAPIQLEYTGPGATVTTLDVLPDTTIIAPDQLQMRTLALDQNNQPVANLNLTWTVNDAARASINGDGVLTPVGPRGSVTVTAALPTGISGSATVAIQSRPTTLLVIAGADQSATVGGNLPNAIEAEVRAADNLPVAGHPISFTYSGTNGTLLQSGSVTDANGRASASVGVGTLAGTHTVTITAAGITPLTVNATATAGAATAAVAGANLTVTDTAGSTLGAGNIPRVTVRDVHSNGVPGVQVKFRRHSGAGASMNAQPDTVVLATTGADGVAALTGRRLQTLVGFDTVLATATGLNDTLRFAATVTHASATQLAFVQQPPTASAGATMSPDITVDVRDQFGNRVTTGAAATSNVTLAVAGATIGGTTTVAAVAGLATFSNVTVSPAGTGYTMTASSAPLTAATSAAFNVTNAAPTTRTWAVASTGAWETAANWSGGAVPGPQDTVVINLPGSYAVLLSSAATVAKLVVGGGAGAQLLQVNGIGASLTVGDSVRVHTTGGLVLTPGNTGTVLTSGKVLVHGSMQWHAGSIAGTGSIEIASGATFLWGGNVPGTLIGRTLQNFGTALFTGEVGTLTLAEGASIENAGDFIAQGHADIVQGTGPAGAFHNSGTFSKAITDANTMTIGVAFNNTGTVDIQAGTLAFTGPAFTNSSAASIRGDGTLDVTGTTFSAAGTVAPGFSPGTINFVGNLPLVSTSQVNIELQGLTPDTEHDVVAVSGVATLGGTLNVTLPFGYTPNEGDSFTIMTFGSRSGTFATTTGLQLDNGRRLDVQYDATSVRLVVVSDIPVPTVTWVAATSGNWSNPANWSTNAVPTSGDIVGITLGGNYTVTLDVNATIAGLLLGVIDGSGTQILNGTGRTLTINGASYVTNDGRLELITSTLNGGGTLRNVGQVLLRSTTLASGITFRNESLAYLEGSTAINGPVIATTGSWIAVQGTTAGGSANVTIAEGFTNAGTLELTNGSTGGWGSTLTITNGTLLTPFGGQVISSIGASGGSRVLAAQLVNQGMLEVDQDLTLNKADADHVNSGDVDLSNADLTITQTGTSPSFVNTGFISFGTIRSLTISGGAVSLTGGNATGTGGACIVLTNVQLTLAPSAVAVALTLSNTTVNGGSLALANGEMLSIRNGSLTAAVAIQSGAVLRALGTTSITGAVTLDNGGTLRLDGNSSTGSVILTVLNGFTNNGLIEMTNTTTGGWGARLIVTNGTLTNVGTISALPGTSGGTRVLAAELNNSGTLTVATPLTLDRAESDHINNSTITLNAANLTVTQTGTSPSFTNLGTIALTGSGRTMTVSGGHLDINQGTISGALGTVLTVTTSATVDLLPSTVLIPIRLTSATVNGTVTVPSSQSLTLLDGALSAPITVENGGTLLLMGTVALNGAVTLNSGGLIRMDGNSTGGSSTATVLNGFTNNGTLELTNSTTGGWGSRLNVTNGELVNAGAINVLPGTSGGSRTLGVQLNNSATGTLTVSQALTLDRLSAMHVNNSTITLATANMTVTQTGTTPSFTNNGVIALSGANRTLTVNGGHLDVNQGSITGGLGTGTLVVTGGATVDLLPNTVLLPVTLTSATVNGSVVIQSAQSLTLLDGALSAPLTIEGGGQLLGMGNLALNGTLTLNTGGLLRADGNSTGGTSFVTVLNGFTNNGTISLTNTTTGGWGSRIIVTNGSLTNAGTIDVLPGTSGGARQISAQLINGGTLNIGQALTIDQPGADHINNAPITLDAANLIITQSGTTPSFTNNSTITMSGTNRTMTVSGGHLDVNQGAINGSLGAGTLIVNGGATVDLGVNNVAAPITLTSATVNNPISLISGQSMILLDGALNAAMSIGTGGTLRAMGTLALNGTVSLTGGTFRVEGNSTGGSATVTVLNGFTNSALIELTNTTAGGWGARLNVTNGELVNNGSLDVLQGTSGGIRVLGAQLNNGANGTVTVGSAGQNVAFTIDRGASDHQNNNMINLAGGNLTVIQSGVTPTFTNNSSISMSGTNRTMTVNGGHLDINQGIITGALGAGHLIVTGGATVDLGVANITAPLTLTNATVTAPITIADGQTLRLLDGALNAAVAINGGGTGGLLIAMGTVALNGAISTQASTVSGQLRVDGNATGGSAVVTVANGFTNAGAIQLTNSAPGGWGARLNVTNGALTNTGTISTLLGNSGGTRALGAELNNSGTLAVGTNASLTIDRASSNHTNSGAITMNANLTIDQTAGFSFSNTGTISLAATRVLTVNGGTITNGSTGNINGSGNNSFTFNGSTFTNSGNFRPGGASTAGTTTITGNWSQTATGTTHMEIGGATAGTQYDRMNISGIATLGGTLTLTTINGYVAPSSSLCLTDGLSPIYTLMTFASRSGDFATINYPWPGTPSAGTTDYRVCRHD